MQIFLFHMTWLWVTSFGCVVLSDLFNLPLQYGDKEDEEESIDKPEQEVQSDGMLCFIYLVDSTPTLTACIPKMGEYLPL